MKCPIPLYHGTNSFILSSIKKHGLGGINIVEEWEAQKAFDKLFEIFQDNKTWIDNHFNNLNKNHHEAYYAFPEFELVYENNYSNHSNWRHGQTYLTGSIFRGCNYACMNIEIIHFIRLINDLLIDLDILKNEDDILSDFQKILKFIHTKKEPILIEIERDSLDFSILGEEIKGKDLSDNDDHIPVRPETINLINLFLSNNNMSEILQSVNFELLDPAPSGKIKFFKMTHDAHKSLELLNASMGLEELKQI